MSHGDDERPGYQKIFRKWITTKKGKRIYASQKGLKAFSFWVKIKDEKSKPGT